MVVKFDYQRSGQTVSHYLHVVLKAVLGMHTLFLVKPTPVPDDSTDPRWKWFKGCLGALDWTYIDLHVPACDKPRFRTRKGHISINVLGVCDGSMRFVYVLPGWEGSGMTIEYFFVHSYSSSLCVGNYYLGDNGYANSDGFLVPYRGYRYHLKEWGPSTQRPVNHQDHFNMRHTRARNVIERAFGVLKMRFGILRSVAYYPVKTQVRLIMACFLLHNFIRSMMPVNPYEVMLDVVSSDEDVDEVEPNNNIDGVESTPEWNLMREELSISMFNQFQSRS
ncbi:hypothetical protein ACS0TY_035031 [Phlomoides rotata]